jgi:diguanylate cyclase (GGDEF)-like protein
VSLLTLLYGATGVRYAVVAAWPPSPHTPVWLLAALAAVGLTGGACVWLLNTRMGPATRHLAVAVIGVLAGVLAWRLHTAAGIVSLGPAMLAIGMYAAFFLPPRSARIQVALQLAAVSAGAWTAVPSGFPRPWVNLCVSVVVVSEVVIRLASGLRRQATTDPLTGVVNRRAWEDTAAQHLARAGRTGESVTIALLDLDKFKGVNDRHGHGAGDALLRDLTAGWRSRLRGGDLLGRYGGDEFALCLPATDDAGAADLLEQLSAAHPFAWSTGVATGRPGESLTDVMARADADLYAAKRSRQAAGLRPLPRSALLTPVPSSAPSIARPS